MMLVIPRGNLALNFASCALANEAMSLRLATFWLTCAIVALSHAQESPSVPRLLGIVSLPGKSLAVVEIDHSLHPQRYVLEAGDSFGDFTLRTIEPAKGAVTLRVAGTNAPVVLKVPELPGSREEPALHLRAVPNDVLLELYQRISGRTILRGPGLPTNRLDLISDPRLDARQALAVLVSTLGTNGVAVTPSGRLFAFAVRPSELNGSIGRQPHAVGYRSYRATCVGSRSGPATMAWSCRRPITPASRPRTSPNTSSVC
jgi:hypothetical protein